MQKDRENNMLRKIRKEGVLKTIGEEKNLMRMLKKGNKWVRHIPGEEGMCSATNMEEKIKMRRGRG